MSSLKSTTLVVTSMEPFHTNIMLYVVMYMLLQIYMLCLILQTRQI